VETQGDVHRDAGLDTGPVEVRPGRHLRTLDGAADLCAFGVERPHGLERDALQGLSQP